ncbi:MAG: winged helix-turn-helix domain-containing protein [Planctomycetota bacterium]|nr:winged helix-turn-helix domain-containing protein [Planctomycetota bacterium]
MRPLGTAEELQRRRIRAVELMESGQSHTQIAEILGVDRGSLYRWRTMARSGPDGLIAIPHPGAPRQMDDAQLHELEFLLGQGAKAHGWPNELWTSKRVANLIQKFFGVQYHEGHVRKIVRKLLHWSSQKPECQARERDEAEIERWKQEEFPRIKKSPRPKIHAGLPRRIRILAQSHRAADVCAVR